MGTLSGAAGFFALAENAGIDLVAVDFFFYLYLVTFASAFLTGPYMESMPAWLSPRFQTGLRRSGIGPSCVQGVIREREFASTGRHHRETLRSHELFKIY